MAAQRGFDRIVNLSDAVVAIAATLLVLPLVDTASSIDSADAAGLLADHGNDLFAFVLSFAVICRFWLVHHGMFTKLVGFTRPLLWVNFVWMLGIAFLPFPTELIAYSGVDHPVASGLYVGTMLVTSAASTAQQWIAIGTPSIQAVEVRGTLTIAPGLSATVALLVVLVIVLVLPDVGLWALLLLLPAGWIGAFAARRIRRSDAVSE
jgi:uncharacterized membrane protein